MKIIEVEKTVKETFYEAIDGKTFKTKDECIKYENTAKCVIEHKYKILNPIQITEFDLFGVGSEEGCIDIIRITHDRDKEIILQKCALYNNNKETLEKYSKILDNTLINDRILCYSGSDYNDYFYVMCNYTDYIKNLNSKVFNENN